MDGYRKVLAFVRPFTRPLIVAAILTGSLTLIGLLPPLLMRRLINDVARQSNWGIFELIIGLLIVVPVVRAAINVANGLILRKVNLGIIADTRKKLFDHLMRLGMDFYHDTPPGNIVQRLMGDIFTVSSVVTGGMIMLLTDVFAVTFTVIVMVRLSICAEVDMIVVMRKGAIEQVGTHEQLLATPGLYRRMYRRQMGLR